MAIISQETIQRILDSTDIVEMIQSYFPLKRAGVNWVAICPFHNEKSASFNVNPQRQIFHCFGCHAGGDAIKFVMMYDNLPFPEAAKKLADQAGVQIREEILSPQDEAKIRGKRELLRMQKAAADWFNQLLFKKTFAQPARDYLKSRGLGMEVSRSWKFGYAPPDQRLFFDWARGEGFSTEQLVSGGLAKWSDENNPNRGAYSFFRHRLMFPVNNDMGDPVAFSGRVLSPDQKGGKYVNSPETILFNKSKTFFGLDRAKRAILRENRAIVCEGQLDVIAVHEAGVENAVAGLGTAFTEDHGKVLKRHAEEVVLCFDSDTAGLNAAGKAFRVLAPSGMVVRLALLPEGEDPDSLIRKQGVDAFREILANSQEFFDFQIDRRGSSLNTGTLRDRLNFARDLANDIALIEDKMLQDSLISRVTVRLGVGEDEIRKLVRNARVAQERVDKAKTRREAVQRNRQSDRGFSSTPPEEFSAPPDDEPIEITNRSVRLLCRALLTDTDSRNGLASEDIPTFFRDITETELLAKIWRAQIDPETPASVNAFIAQLSENEQRCVRRILSEDSARVSPALTRECLAALKKQSLQRQISVVKTQMSAPNLRAADLAHLGKQLLDLREQLNER